MSHTRTGLALMMLLACSGCFGRGPGAYRIRPDTNDRYYPQREIHFVEHGHRSRGVLVMATSGGDSPFTVGWATILVPIPPTPLEGPVWRGRTNREEALAIITELPAYRSAWSITHYGNMARFRFHELAVWVLSTDPFIVGLPAGEPVRSWRQFAVMATGVREREAQYIPPVSQRTPPAPPLIVRYVVDEELDQPLARLVVFPPDFFEQAATGQLVTVELSLITLSQPMRIDEALDAITQRDPLRLGTVEMVSIYEHLDPMDIARSRIADRERLLSQ